MKILNEGYDWATSVNGSIVHVDEKIIIVIMSESNSSMFDELGLVVQTVDNSYETVDHQISDYTSVNGLRKKQWLVKFNRR